MPPRRALENRRGRGRMAARRPQNAVVWWRAAEREGAMGPVVERMRAALLLVAVALAAALSAAACVGERSEAGTAIAQAQPVEAAQQGEGASAEPLTLTLRGQPTCDTPPAQGYGRAVVRWDEAESKWVYTTHSDGWFDVGETPVAWRVSGGVPPYELMIDGEARDAEQAYEGASGVASVSCAQRFDETFFDEDGRGYLTEPEVDSGLKTIRATVTDGAGATAEASVDVYVILELPGSGSILERGKTYRVFGRLITAPTSHDVQVGSTQEADCPEPPASTARCGIWLSLQLVHARARISLHMSGDAEEVRQYYATNGAWGPAAIENEMIEAAFDALIDSLDRRPSVEQAGS